jgi:hypothetical protein
LRPANADMLDHVSAGIQHGWGMAFRFGSPIDRRQAILSLLAAGGTFVSPMRALALAERAPEKAYAAFFLGQGGYLFSWGIPYLAFQARALGMETDIFGYSDVRAAWTEIIRKKENGYKIALVGYSLGNTTITYLQRYLEVDLLLAISESSLGRNHPIKKENTRRSVLWYGPDFLSNAGLKDGFDKINYVDAFHLWMNVHPRVVNGVLGELKDLVQLEQNEGSGLAAKPTIPQTTSVAQAGGVAATGAGPAPARSFSAGWLPPPSLPITGDVTCTHCWGFEQSLMGAQGLEPWTL